MKSDPFYLSPEFFAQHRQSLVKRKAELTDLVQEMRTIDEQLDRLDADEKLAADLASRYGSDLASERPKKRASPKRPTPSRPVPSGRPWTPEEDFLVMSRDDDAELARQMGRKESSIAKRRRVVRGRPADGAADREVLDRMHAGTITETTSVEIGESPAFPGPAEPNDSEPSSSEKPEISEPTPTPHKALTGNERAPPPKPGRVVEGIVDDGPGRPRYYDPVAHASREPR